MQHALLNEIGIVYNNLIFKIYINLSESIYDSVIIFKRKKEKVPGEDKKYQTQGYKQGRNRNLPSQIKDQPTE